MVETCIGMMGAGFIGAMHSLAFNSARDFAYTPRLTARLKTLVDNNPKQASRVGDRFQWENVGSHWSEIVSDPEVKLFINAAPNGEHLESSIAAAKAGKHIFSEKPLARTADEAYALWSQVEQTGVHHICAFVHRFIPALQLARQMIQAGELGEILHFRSNIFFDMREPGGINWRFNTSAAGGGATGDLGSHHIDQARFMIGEVANVRSAATKTWTTGANGYEDINDDWFTAVLELETGATAVFEASRVLPGHPLTGRIEVDGTKGTISWDIQRVSELTITEPHKGHRTQSVTQPGHPYCDFWLPIGVQQSFAVGWRDAFYYQARHILAAVALGEPVAPIAATFRDGYRVAEIVDAVLRSAVTGQAERVVFREA